MNDSNQPAATGGGFKRTLLGLIPLFILLGGVAFAIGIRIFTPEVQRRPAPPVAAPTVVVQEITPAPYQVVVESYGTVKPRTESKLVAQVSGQVISINSSLREGGFFEKDEELLRIDDRDYLANVKIAEAALLDARQALVEEQARSAQARADWDRLGNAGEAPDLVLRKPQLNAAEARVASAQSSLEKARLNLERTIIRAPYAGRVRQKSVDVGQVVSAGSSIADIWASDYVEVRLPLRDKDLPFVELPESYRNGAPAKAVQSPVVLSSSLVPDSDWQGVIVRTESAIDESARQLHCVAQIDDPFGAESLGRTPLKIGEYVTARIQGRLLDDAIVIPVSAIYQSTFAYVVEQERLQRRNVDIAWQNDKEAIINAGLTAGDLLVLTPLGQVTSGLKVNIKSQLDAPKPEPGISASGVSNGTGVSQ
ncbi:MAG: efflux RND transporter periplasmic adaptor subunit [Gammaproteobacteria bacterium]|nr:efflux RND transporter periplasmic adaptor subunit [Gammaproteobacteria bacterium]